MDGEATATLEHDVAARLPQPVKVANAPSDEAQPGPPSLVKGSLPVLPLAPVLGLVTVSAFLLRALFIGQQSAYLDEATFVLTGRTLLEKHAEYAQALNWTYGSYLWSIVAAEADMAGGLYLVRLVASCLGAVMALATAITAARLVPERSATVRGWVGLLAGLIMAMMPTAMAVGRFGTYDPLAGAAFMSGVAFLVPARPAPCRSALLTGAILLFVAFLAKYVVAIFFPFLCIYLLLAPRRWLAAGRSILWFSAPLAAACAAYFLVFNTQLRTLLTFSGTYTDLKSATPWAYYVSQRPELWLLALLATFGLGKASPAGRTFSLTGIAILAAFQALARPDADWWKHSIYLIFFLSPLAGLALASLLESALLAAGQPKLTMGWRVVVTALVAGVAVGKVGGYGLEQSNRLVTFYPNLNPSLDAIRQDTLHARLVLTDDDALRYYLYGRLPVERVVDPFGLTYRGLQGMDGYRQAISDRYFDVIVLDGGIGPLAARIKGELGAIIPQYYDRIYARETRGRTVEIYRPRDELETPANDVPEGTAVYWFDGGLQGWGGQPERASLRPGLQVAINQEQTWKGHPSLEFTVSPDVSLLAVGHPMNVSQLRAVIFLRGSDEAAPAVPLGMVGFDQGWVWHDDGFRQLVPTGRWVDVSWKLPQPGKYNEVGLKVRPEMVRAVYVGHFEIQP